MHKDTKLILATTCLCVLIGIGAWGYRQKKAADVSLLVQHRQQDQTLKRSIEAKLQSCSSAEEAKKVLKQEQFVDIRDYLIKGKRTIQAARWQQESEEAGDEYLAPRAFAVRIEFIGNKRSSLTVELGVGVE